jgi:hypothetical protein
MHLLVILLQQLLGLIPNKQQAQPEPVRVRTAPPAGTPEQQAFQSSQGLNGYGAELLRTGATVFCESTASARPSRAVLRALGGDCGRAGLDRANVLTVDGTLPVDQSGSSASPISLKSADSLESQGALSPESRA